MSWKEIKCPKCDSYGSLTYVDKSSTKKRYCSLCNGHKVIGQKCFKDLENKLDIIDPPHKLFSINQSDFIKDFILAE